MQIFRHVHEAVLKPQGSIVTLGNFDGIHLGHRALIAGTVADARQLAIPSVVLTFEPHPLKVLAPDRAPKMLLTHKEKMRLLQDLGVDIVIVQHFDLAFAQIGAEEFVRELFVARLKPRRIWVGRDLRFGQGRKGSVADLQRWALDLGFEVSIVEPILVDGVRVSSSRVRQLISEGKVDEVKPLLGRYHFVSGKVVGGQRRGKDLGFPTANIAAQTEVLPLDGIYATLFQLGSRALPSVSSVGFNPTFGPGPRTVESYIFDFHEDIYGERARLSFIKRIREEKKFSSPDDLVKQIKADVRCAERIFHELGLPE
ncbi:MAG TPA: bifunctional riboflavin kinase/FAD synthetase [Candidatus Binatia bacterium]|nr:bifunctional riboflavin kinase/FAD synthetase [Candidatus Binatia bacterium]